MESADLNNLSAEELSSRIGTFSGQLQDIELILQDNPENKQQLLQLQQDLAQVITLHKQVLALKQTPDENAQFPNGSKWEYVHKSVGYPVVVEKSTKNELWLRYFGFENKQFCLTGAEAGAALRALQVASAAIDENLLVDEYKCQAKYYLDGKYYSCTIVDRTALGYHVLFTDYGNTEEVPMEYLRAAVLVNGQKEGEGKDSKKQHKEQPQQATGAAGSAAPGEMIQIPENLKILPTDTETEKERKKKRIKAIKSKNRHQTIENERNSKKAGWQNFQSNLQKNRRSKSGMIKTKKRVAEKSIFASPATVDGKVGVVGSGQNMTNFPDTRKKYKLNTLS